MSTLNISAVPSVSFQFRLSEDAWAKKQAEGLRKFFEDHGNVTGKKKALPVANQPATPRAQGEILVPSTEKFGLDDFVNALCKRKYIVFSASHAFDGGKVIVKFMLCPKAEVEWDNERPFVEMQEALLYACGMATYRAMVYNNPYINPFEPDRKDVRALSVNSDHPDWLIGPDGKPLMVGGKMKGPSFLIGIAKDGEIKVQ